MITVLCPCSSPYAGLSPQKRTLSPAFTGMTMGLWFSVTADAMEASFPYVTLRFRGLEMVMVPAARASNVSGST